MSECEAASSRVAGDGTEPKDEQHAAGKEDLNGADVLGMYPALLERLVLYLPLARGRIDHEEVVVEGFLRGAAKDKDLVGRERCRVVCKWWQR